MKLKFRAAKSEISEINKIVRLVNSGYRGDSSKKGWTTEADLLDGQRTDAEMISELIARKDSYIMLAFDENNNLVSSVHLQLNDKRCELGMLTVDPERQNVGLGKIVMEYCEKFAKEKLCENMRIEVIPLRPELIAFYLRRGYKPTGKVRGFGVTNPRFGLPKVDGLCLAEYMKEI